jgi:hypothetical protein
MLEQILEGLKDDPSPHKIRAFLCLVDTLNDPDKKAEALADFGRLRLRVDAFEALKALQCAFRLSPKNQRLLEAMEWVFTALNREDAHKRIAMYRQSIQKEEMPPSEKSDTKAPMEFEENVKTTRSAPFNTSLGTSPLERISLDFSLPDASETQGVPLSPQPAWASQDTKVESSILADNPPAPLRFTFSQNEAAFGIFAEYLRTTGLDFRLLEKAEGFQDSTLGLVLFVNYLRENEKISKEKIAGATEILRTFVFRKDSDVRSQVRFHELFEMTLSEK